MVSFKTRAKHWPKNQPHLLRNIPPVYRMTQAWDREQAKWLMVAEKGFFGLQGEKRCGPWGGELGHIERKPTQEICQEQTPQQRRLQGHCQTLLLGLGWTLVGGYQGHVTQALHPGIRHLMFPGEHLSLRKELVSNSHPHRRASRQGCHTTPQGTVSPLQCSPLLTLMDPEGLGSPSPQVWGMKGKRSQMQLSLPQSPQMKQVQTGEGTWWHFISM